MENQKFTPLTKEYYLGTAIKIICQVNIELPTSVTISIENPNNSKVVTDADMIKETTGIYYYIYQTTEYDIGGNNAKEGIYKAEITVTSENYQTISLIDFRMKRTFN